jgi:uncharacterized Tic20 family protein
MFGEEVIKILDALCEKFGIAIDWTSKTVAPYLQDLGSRIINFEIGTSIFWIVLPIILTIATWIIARIIDKKVVDCCDFEDYLFIYGLPVILTITSIIVIGCQIYDIIMCGTIPEAIIIRYAQNLMTNMTN